MAGWVIGRDVERSQIVIPRTYSKVSRTHARLTHIGDGNYLVEDLGSTYGTFVNSQGNWRKITSIQVTSNHKIRFANYETRIDDLVAKPYIDDAAMKPLNSPPRHAKPEMAPIRTPDTKVVATKLATALYPDAVIKKPGYVKYLFMIAGPGAAGGAQVGELKMNQAFGGTMIAGKAIVHMTKFVFRPHSKKFTFCQNCHPTEIPFPEITGIQTRELKVVKLVSVTAIDLLTKDGKFTFRCFGAEEFANIIRRQMAH